LRRRHFWTPFTAYVWHFNQACTRAEKYISDPHELSVIKSHDLRHKPTSEESIDDPDNHHNIVIKEVHDNNYPMISRISEFSLAYCSGSKSCLTTVFIDNAVADMVLGQYPNRIIPEEQVHNWYKMNCDVVVSSDSQVRNDTAKYISQYSTYAFLHDECFHLLPGQMSTLY